MAWVLALCLPVIAAASGPEPLPAPAEAGTSRPLDAATMAALGITESPAAEAASLARPVAPESGTWSWTPGQYSYDGSGNITAIGTEASFLYDTRGRLVDATLTRAQATEHRGYVYDAFGNRTSMTVGSSSIPTITSTSTNHLTGLSAVYDAAGNVTQLQPPGQSTIYQQKFDALGMIQEVKAANVSGTPTRLHIYTSADERLWTFDLAANASHWKIRDLEGKVLRDYYVPGTTWTLARDYVYRDGRLLAAVTPTETLHFSLDHLGTPRVITGADRNRLGFHHYLPFGEEWTDQSGAQEGEVMKFTGHERDPDVVSGGVNGFDYMHARYYSASIGRFLSVDPKSRRMPLKEPQLYNRYSYALNNPLNLVDLDGEDVTPIRVLMTGGKPRIAYVDSRMVPRLQNLVTAAHKQGVSFTFSSLLRTQDQQDSIKTGNTKNNKGTSPHTAGLAIDINIATSLKGTDLAGLTGLARDADLSPLRNQADDKPHFQANDLITRGDDGKVDDQFKDLVEENQQQVEAYEKLRKECPEAFENEVVLVVPPL